MNLCKNEIDPSYIADNGQCVYKSISQMSYFDARMACIAMGGDLAQIDTIEKHTWMNPLFQSDSNYYWIGAVSTRWLLEDSKYEHKDCMAM